MRALLDALLSVTLAASLALLTTSLAGYDQVRLWLPRLGAQRLVREVGLLTTSATPAGLPASRRSSTPSPTSSPPRWLACRPWRPAPPNRAASWTSWRPCRGTSDDRGQQARRALQVVEPRRARGAWRGTAWGVVQAVNTYAHHEGIVRNADRAERNMMRAVNGRVDKLNAVTVEVLTAS